MTRARTWTQRKHDRGIATMLSLLVTTRIGSRTEIEAYQWELISRATMGAKLGDG